jgi:predicted transcriptional regulator YdeE
MQVVEIKSFTVHGLSTRTKNANEIQPATAKIGQLWGDFFQHIIPKLKEGALSYGVYSQYESDFNGEFTVLVGADSASVVDAADREGLDSVVITSGSYLVFSKKGAMPQAVIEAWGDVWAYFSAKDCPHQRAYTSDFERYRSESEMSEVDIYIAISN